jgi:hypothetical protein
MSLRMAKQTKSDGGIGSGSYVSWGHPASPKVAVAVPIAMPSPLSPLALPQHAVEHGSERPVLLAVDQELGEGVRLSG